MNSATVVMGSRSFRSRSRSMSHSAIDPSIFAYPMGLQLTVGPFAGYSETFKLAHVKTFEDLHKLGFVPDGYNRGRCHKGGPGR
jgi:hypothetical protein